MTERTPSSATPMPALNEMRRTDDLGPQDTELPVALSTHFRQQGRTWRRVGYPESVVVVDRGHRMHTFAPESLQTVGAMATAAHSRGWKAMEVSGTDTFRRAAYIEVAARGMEVTGYEPSAADRAAASRGADLLASLRNPKVQAYLMASSEVERSNAIEAYPSLGKVFAAEDGARRVLGRQPSVSPEIAGAFIARFRENTAIALHKGRELPGVSRAAPSSGVER